MFHLATPSAWDAALAAGRIEPPSLADEGFVHCSTAEQLAGTIERHFADAVGLVLVELAPEVAPELRWEEGRPGVRYPHLYRGIEAVDVLGVHHWHRSTGTDDLGVRFADRADTDTEG